MSFVSTAAVATASFLNATELPPVAPVEIYSVLDQDLVAGETIMQAPLPSDHEPSILLAQSGEDIIRGIIGNVIRNQLEEQGIIPERQPSTQNAPVRLVTRDGIANVEDGEISPNEVVSSNYVGSNNQTGQRFWDLNVEGYGVVCGVAENTLGPEVQIMEIAQYNDCRSPRQSSPYDNVRIVEDSSGYEGIPAHRNGISSRLMAIIEDDYIAPSEMINIEQIGTGPSRLDGHYYYDITVTSGDIVCGKYPTDYPPEIGGADYVQPVPCRESWEPSR